MAPSLHLLECTLRDGSYVVDFQFTARDTAVISAGLEAAGARYIEVGHGLGLNASHAGKGVAAATDEEYMQAATQALRSAQWGMFFIPGIGRHEDLELAARYGMNFVRIGTNANQVEAAQPYIEHARRLGLFVSSNLMKSYALEPAALAQQAHLVESYGANLVCLVDSAGCMLPDDVAQYTRVLLDVVECPIGFHCHDNLGLGVANVLAAVQAGATWFDGTLQGMGRGAGNPPTELLVSVFERLGHDLGYDGKRLLDLGERVIKPLLRARGLDALDVVCGIAGFHSSHLGTIRKYAERYHVDARDLIRAVSEVDRVNAPEPVVDALARRLGEQPSPRAEVTLVSLSRVTFPRNETGIPALAEAAARVAHDVRSIATKKGRRGVLNVVTAPQAAGQAVVSRFVQEEFAFVIGSVELDNPTQLGEVVRAVDGVVELLLVDADRRPFLEQPLAQVAAEVARQSQVLGYKDTDVWVRTVERQLAVLLRGVTGRRIVLIGADPLALKLAQSLTDQGADVRLTDGDPDALAGAAAAVRRLALVDAGPEVQADPRRACDGAEALVCFARRSGRVTQPMIAATAPGAVVVDGGIGAVAAPAIAWAHDHGRPVVRPDMRAALAAELMLATGAEQIVRRFMGRGEIAGVPVVAGGLLGRYGDVVVDALESPSRVVGIADGSGLVLYDPPPELQPALARVEGEILRRQAL